MASLSARLRAARGQQRDYSPVSWTQYFDEAHDVTLEPLVGSADAGHQTPPDSFRVYLRNFTQPWAPQREPGQVLDATQCELSQADHNKYSQYPTLVALHGGGYSALTWAQFTRFIEQQCQCRILAIDLRNHGDTKTSDDERMDIDTLVTDVIRVTHATHRLCGFIETPKLVLIGHSMGGAIAVKCSTRCLEAMPSLAGFVIIDVVEGTAKDALPLMMSVIKTRPTKFLSLSNAIEWSVRSGMAKNADAARVSMPGNLLNITTGHLSIHDIQSDTQLAWHNTLKKHKFHISLEHLLSRAQGGGGGGGGGGHPVASLPKGLPVPPRVACLRGDAAMSPPPLDSAATTRAVVGSLNECQEESSEDEQEMDKSSESHEMRKQTIGPTEESASSLVDDDGYKKPPDLDLSGYCWRIDLAKTQPYWNGWFDGLSEQLLTAPVQGKFLLLAGIDRLDKTLTIGQMQGKFMMKVLPKCGHAVHEDVPEQVASVIGQFLVRNKFTSAQVDKVTLAND